MQRRVGTISAIMFAMLLVGCGGEEVQTPEDSVRSVYRSDRAQANKCKQAGGTWDGSTCTFADPAPAPAPADDCQANGGELCNGQCVYPAAENGCTPCNQLDVCPGGNTSATGPGVCVVDQNNVGTCGYLYRQPCNKDQDCDVFFGFDTAYVCCAYNASYSVCMNPFLCR